MNYKLDTDSEIFFYEQEFYCLSNFSSFTLGVDGKRFDTAEAAYHYEKFPNRPDIQKLIWEAKSAHEAFHIAQAFIAHRRSDWDDVKLQVMEGILRLKVAQHPYVRKKLMQTGKREIIEDSWRDSYWGWGPNKDGQNHLGKLWMKIRDQLCTKNED